MPVIGDCVCACGVCVRKRERGKERQRSGMLILRISEPPFMPVEVSPSKMHLHDKYA